MMFANSGPQGGQGKVTQQKGNIDNSYTFTIQHEDHTLGNLLTQELLTEDRVLFAGYRIHHPMDDWIYVRVNVSDEIESSADLIRDTIERLGKQIDNLQKSFEDQAAQREHRRY